MVRTFPQYLRSGRKWVLLFGLTVLLPSLFIGLLALRTFKGEESRQQFRRKERQQQIIRFLETDLNNWLFSLQSHSKASETLFRFEIDDDQILFPELNITISSYRSRQPVLSLSTEEARLWQEAQKTEMQNRVNATLGKARPAYLQLVNQQPLIAPLARLALLRLALEEKDFNDATRWLNAIRANDRRAITESGIPIFVASALLIAAHMHSCQTAEGSSSFNSEYMNDTLSCLVRGQWRLTGAQWVLYADEVSAALEGCTRQLQADSTAQTQRIRKLIHPLLDAYPQVLVLAKDHTGGIPLEKRYFPELEAFIVVTPGLEQTLGYVVSAQALIELAETRLNDLTTMEDFRGNLVSTDKHRQPIPADMEMMRLNSFPPFQVTFTERQGSGGPLNFHKHFFLYSMILLLSVALLGIVFTYRAVSREVEVTRLKSDFIAAVSHEFRSPLTSMSTLLERLDGGKVRDEEMLHKYHRVIRQELHRLSLLINGLLDFARLEDGKKEFSLEPSNLFELARESVNSFHNLGHADRVNLVEPETPDPPVVAADRVAIAQCIQNLIDNALKYSPTGTPVLVQAGRENGEVFLEVSDRGLGIPLSEQPKIFEQFYRAKHIEVHNVKGTGMGLALVKRLMEKHNGRVTVESRPGEGSKFRLVFPPARINHRDAEELRASRQ